MLAVQLSLGMAVVFDAINKALVPWLLKGTYPENNPQKLQRLSKLTYVFFIIVAGLGGRHSLSALG